MFIDVATIGDAVKNCAVAAANVGVKVVTSEPVKNIGRKVAGAAATAATSFAVTRKLKEKFGSNEPKEKVVTKKGKGLSEAEAERTMKMVNG